ncbi:hypothetical protein EJ05DRAFT_478134 [Pseudovirgaria hyperparasitica]|uniref:Uncharacterized protein n=1 Tax=Pseudovirgaria hyperparasitica TaxID=470096 RepID=A0A6A6W258_9PEZI|nr:uncharacterized protein EJ05DRAFT_478134 [Pseudovirgaria hyperparasitica]KAF2756104.1 hypothetical protein EJ05DRAFT_478134 [Pseudovirgaria hyperparasitica]
MRYHARNRPLVGWEFEEVRVGDVRFTNTLLARVTIAKVVDERRLVELFRVIPVVNDDPNWRCRSWIQQALAAIAHDQSCVSSCELDWARIEAFARQYVAEKTAAGRYAEHEDMLKPKPTYDLLEEKETIA